MDDLSFCLLLLGKRLKKAAFHSGRFRYWLAKYPRILYICKRPVKGFLGHHRLDYNVELFDL